MPIVPARHRDACLVAAGRAAAYPQVALRDRAAYVLAIGDIQEPNRQWRTVKFQKRQRPWDYVFRRLFYTSTTDVSENPFDPPMEIDSVEATGGHITNLDLHVDDQQTVHLLYLKQPHYDAVPRDTFFPGQPFTRSLEYITLKDGKIAKRTTLVQTPVEGEGFDPSYGRFHVGTGGQMYVVAAGTAIEVGRDPRVENRLFHLGQEGDGTPLSLEHPLRSFFTATPRGGTRPSQNLDLFGIAADGLNLRYAGVDIATD